VDDKTAKRPPTSPSAEDRDALELTRQRSAKPATGETFSARPSVLKGRFELTEVIGAGGMGVVYKSWDRSQNLFVAVKIINDSPDIDKHTQSAAFRAEARKTLELSHPNIVRTYDFDIDDKMEFLTMELLEGESFDSVINRYPSGVPWTEAAPLISQLFEGIAFAHNQGIIHSDLKPSNVFVTQNQVVKILDFGIASRAQRIGQTQSKTQFNPREHGALSPAYASKEMFEGKEANPRDDVYSLACVLYEFLSGKHPFDRTTSVCAFTSKKQAEAISGLTRGQNKALMKALSLESRDRTPTVAQFRQELFARPISNWRPLIMTVAIALALSATFLFLSKEGMLSDNRTRSPNKSTTSVVVGDMRTTPTIGGTAMDEGVNPAASAFEAKCKQKPSGVGLAALVDTGLKEQAALAFAPNDTERAEALSKIKDTASCLRDLEKLGFESSQSRRWLNDVGSNIAPE
jgi:serine/threonine protein kinase